MSAVRVVLVAVMLSTAAVAHAQEVPGALTNASGLTASAAGGIMLRAMPVWREADGTLVALSEDPGSALPPPPECWDDATTPATELRGLLSEGALPSDSGSWHVAASARDGVIAMHQRMVAPGTYVVRLYRASCAAGSTETVALGEVALPAGDASTTIAIPSERRNAWPLIDGAIVVALTNGAVVKIDPVALTATPIDVGGERPQALGNTPSGAIWIATEAPPGAKLYRYDGALTLLSASSPGFTMVLPAPELGGVLLGPSSVIYGAATFSGLALEPEADPLDWSRALPAWPSGDGFDDDGFVGGADGSVWVRAWHDVVGDTNEIGRRYSLRRVGVDEARRDFDRDQLRGADEAAAGTSDLQWDSDGDGFDDAYEVERHTRGDDATSHPAAAPTTPTRIAQSVFPAYPASTTACVAAPPEAGADAAVCAAMPYPANGNFTPDGRWWFGDTNDPSSGARVSTDVFDTRDGSHTRFMSSATQDAGLAGFQTVEAHAVSNDALVFVGRDQGAVLFTGDDRALRFIDVARPGCMLVHDEAELAACTTVAPRNELHAVRAVGVVGDMLVVRFDDRYYGAGAGGVFDLGDVVDTSDGLELYNLVRLPDGAGWLGQGASLVGAQDGRGGHYLASSFLYDEHLRLQGYLPYVSALQPLGTWDGAGYRIGDVGLFFKRIQLPAKCDTNPWAFDPKCGNLMTDTRVERTWPMAVDFRVVPEALAPGEIIMASQHTYVRPPPEHGGLPVPVMVPDEDGVYRTFEVDEPVWRLWRLTANGAVDHWLSAGRFAALADGAGVAALATTPLGEVTALRARPDGRALCLAESGRVWELALDAGLLGGVRLAGSGRACAYDEAGRLAVLGATSIAIGGKTLPVSGDPIELVRTTGGWLVADGAGMATCALDDGTQVTLDARLVAIAEAALAGPGAVTTVDDHGAAWIGGDPCHGHLRDELLYGDYLWAFLYDEMLGLAQPAEVHDALAQRPDGSYVVSGGTLEIFPAKLVWSFQPTYQPGQATTRIAALDPFRQQAASRTLLSQYLTEVGAMVTLPGGDPHGDWGRPPLVPYVAPTTPTDPDAPGDPTDPTDPTGPTPKDGGGCAGGEADAWWLFAAGAAWRRRRVDAAALVEPDRYS